MKYRSRSDIVGLLLDAANGGGATKTKLMYKAYLSFNQLREYLALLVENGLIEYQEGMQTYRTTGKGIQLLQIQNTMDEIAPISYSNGYRPRSLLQMVHIITNKTRRRRNSILTQRQNYNLRLNVHVAMIL